jgi:hypothetical protein
VVKEEEQIHHEVLTGTAIQRPLEDDSLVNIRSVVVIAIEFLDHFVCGLSNRHDIIMKRWRDSTSPTTATSPDDDDLDDNENSDYNDANDDDDDSDNFDSDYEGEDQGLGLDSWGRTRARVPLPKLSHHRRQTIKSYYRKDVHQILIEH